MILKAAGGLPPKGQNMNQILFELSDLMRWASTGAINSFDPAFSSAISGYPSGALVLSDAGDKLFISVIDNNTDNPNSTNTGSWKNAADFIGVSESVQQDIDGKLAKDQNGADIPDKNQFVKNLGLTETVDCAKNALDKRTGGTVNGDIISQGGKIGLKGDNRKHFILANADGKVRAYIYKDKGGDGIHINNGIDGGGDYIFHKDGGFRAPSSVYAGAARIASDGNIYGSMWGNQWLDAYLKKTFQPKKTGLVDIVETGSGTGYYWRKFSDGKIEIFGRLDSTYGAPLDVVFPKVFTEIPFLFVKENGDSEVNGWVMRARNLSKTGFSVQWNFFSSSGQGSAMEVCYHAIGS
ncbi:hypothetical protein [Symbiopectobacterium sp. RP]|uniref:hypothetical protein n=1 Tax=Symbiopectobacterium sp. RP TaxID=3248553 RepID=UPI003D2B64C0